MAAKREEKMLTIQEASARLGISRTALYQAMAAGRLKYVEMYGKRLFREKDVAAYVPRNYRAPASSKSARP